MSLLTEINQDTFQKEVIEAKQPVLVDFYTDRCSSCAALLPVLEEIASDYEDKLTVVKFYVSIDDVLENKNKVAIDYDVMSFPTLLLFKDGAVVTTLLGGQSHDDLVQAIDSVL